MIVSGSSASAIRRSSGFGTADQPGSIGRRVRLAARLPQPTGGGDKGDANGSAARRAHHASVLGALRWGVDHGRFPGHAGRMRRCPMPARGPGVALGAGAIRHVVLQGTLPSRVTPLRPRRLPSVDVGVLRRGDTPPTPVAESAANSNRRADDHRGIVWGYRHLYLCMVERGTRLRQARP